MIRQTVRSMALAAAGLLLAGGAWGQVLRQATSEAATVAMEYFGGEGRVVQVSSFDLDMDDTNGQQRPYVGLTVGGKNITAGNVAEITFTLVGATFGQAVSSAHLDQRPGAGCAGTKGNSLEASVGKGGAMGDSSVTFRAEVTDAGGGALETTQQICFWVPDLLVTLATLDAEAMPPTRGVNVAASIATVATTGNNFPGRISGPVTGDMDANDDDDALDGAEVGSAANTDQTIFLAARALEASLGTGGAALVSIADRTKIASGGLPDPSASGTDATMGLMVGTLTVSVASAPIWKLDGSGYLETESIDSSLSGQINLSVGGRRFQTGDKVVVGSGISALTGTPDGMTAEVTVQLGVTAGMPVVYVPGGVDALKPTSFAAMAAFLFNDRRNHNAMIPASTGRIDYAGVNVEGYAYGVVRGGGADSSFVRVTCEATADCAVFADCTGQDGTTYFSDPVPVAAGTTGVVNNDQIAAALGGGWTSGRGRCDLLSTGELSVQHMIRSGDTLINSSAVVGRGLDEKSDGETDDAIAAVQMVVDNICSSTPGIQDLDSAMDGDQSTPCRTVAQ